MNAMRPFLIDDAFKADCERLREFAENPKNWYLFGEVDWTPGDRPEYTIETSFGYKAVFTITHAPDFKPEPFRHLTISVAARDLPNPVVVWTVAHYLGFTGAEVVDDIVSERGPWGVGIDNDEGCIVVQQPYAMLMQ